MQRKHKRAPNPVDKTKMVLRPGQTWRLKAKDVTFKMVKVKNPFWIYLA